ncbi:Uncharacterized conserved protein YkwD, contains CAP (CSP/antigen 5/PR1) domain [Tranquillimonas rosea]|uniref:Uncharacterized conserved protein YkwD, contains CAP (CSP/antigen 5/PR1) domain n=1 Tax=Tranquillimonas rosea TaxID=641238 RepID=A0A1H9U5P2_9RHOB|nr:CAP domain-containing protein [Tranquillimonas rosea]SES04393.1 Uncharacterized conserved protein YkwD, contains CAP (CSP/antigen 5/PR1) domain [Tranquillimonas rosea]
MRLAHVLSLVVLVGTAGAAVAAPCRAPENAAQIKQAILQYSNAERQARGLPALAPNRELSAAAQAQACHIAQRQSLTHRGPRGSKVSDRARAQGYSFAWIAENIGFGQRSPRAIVKAWMNSAGHRKNLLNAKGSEVGSALVVGADGRPYWAMVLGRRLAR